jgi:hypothetical protein
MNFNHRNLLAAFSAPVSLFLAAGALLGLIPAASADVITDWNEKAVAFVVARNMGPPPAERVLAMTHLAMFDAVNSIERKYRPYLAQLPANGPVSKEAAAAMAAGTILTSFGPQLQTEMKAALAAYLETIPDSVAKMDGIRLGRAGFLSDQHRARRLCADGCDLGASMARRETVRDDKCVAIPPGATDCARRSGMGGGL